MKDSWGMPKNEVKMLCIFFVLVKVIDCLYLSPSFSG